MHTIHSLGEYLCAKRQRGEHSPRTVGLLSLHVAALSKLFREGVGAHSMRENWAGMGRFPGLTPVKRADNQMTVRHLTGIAAWIEWWIPRQV